jgi:autotransporter translocation and assembly factor TamB
LESCRYSVAGTLKLKLLISGTAGGPEVRGSLASQAARGA